MYIERICLKQIDSSPKLSIEKELRRGVEVSHFWCIYKQIYRCVNKFLFVFRSLINISFKIALQLFYKCLFSGANLFLRSIIWRQTFFYPYNPPILKRFEKYKKYFKMRHHSFIARYWKMWEVWYSQEKWEDHNTLILMRPNLIINEKNLSTLKSRHHNMMTSYFNFMKIYIMRSSFSLNLI